MTREGNVNKILWRHYHRFRSDIICKTVQQQRTIKIFLWIKKKKNSSTIYNFLKPDLVVQLTFLKAVVEVPVLKFLHENKYTHTHLKD